MILWPGVSITTGSSLNISKPFETPIVIQNNGHVPLYDIHIKYTMRDLELKKGVSFIDSTLAADRSALPISVHKLSAGENTTFLPDHLIEGDDVTSADFVVEASYSTWLGFRQTNDAEFVTVKASDGKLQWEAISK